MNDSMDHSNNICQLSAELDESGADMHQVIFQSSLSLHPNQLSTLTSAVRSQGYDPVNYSDIIQYLQIL